MWDEDDQFARWVQGICALALIAFDFAFGMLIKMGFGSGYGSTATVCETGILIGALYLAARCGWYAITGRNNINRDDYD